MEQTNLRREKSRNKILFALKEGSKRFVDLKRETGLSPIVLNYIRKILLEEGLIQQDNSKAYELTEKGKESSVNASQFNAKTEIKIDLNYSIWDYSTMNGGLSALLLPWGISSELIRDKKEEEEL